MKKYIQIKILCASLIWSGLSFAQNEPNTWLRYIGTTEGGTISYDYASMKREGFPPVAVSAKIFNDRPNIKNYVFNWEFRCNTKEIKVESSNLISVAADNNTERRILLEGLCGIKNVDGIWFVISQTSHGMYAINANSVKMISTDDFVFSGANIGVNASALFVSMSKVFPEEEIRFTCNDRTNPKQRSKVNPDQWVTFNLPANSIGQVAMGWICTGYIPAVPINQDVRLITNNTGQTAALLKNLETAKKTCIDLGFKEKSEKFAQCVLKVSK